MKRTLEPTRERVFIAYDNLFQPAPNLQVLKKIKRNSIREHYHEAINSTDVSSQKDALYQLYRLTKSEEGRADLRETTNIPTLITLLDSHHHIEVINWACAVIQGLTDHTETCDLLRQPELLMRISSLRDTDNISTCHETTVTIKESTAHILLRLMPTHHTQNLFLPLLTLENLPTVIKRFGDENKRIKQEAVKAVCTLACRPSNNKLLTQTNAIHALRKHQNDRCPIVREVISQTLQKLQRPAPNQARPLIAATLASQPNLPAHITRIPSSDLTISTNKLGKGGQGEVFQGTWLKFTPVAIKMRLKDRLSPTYIRHFNDEILLHSSLRHPSIVSFYGLYQAPGLYGMALELIPDGSLYHVLYNQKSKQRIKPMLQKISCDIADGLHYLHSQNILHCDLKSQNILVDFSRKSAKITDFGVAVKLTSNSTLSRQSGTYPWMAPEVILDKKTSKASDVYSLGVILWEASTGTQRFRGYSLPQMKIAMQAKEKVGDVTKMPAKTPPQYALLIADCWEERAKDRPTAESVTTALHHMTFSR